MSDGSGSVVGIIGVVTLAGALPFAFLATGMVLVFWVLFYGGVVVGIWRLTRRNVRLVVDSTRRVVAVGPEGREKPVAMQDIKSVELSARQQGRARTYVPTVHCIELVLQSRERVPLTGGYGRFGREDCVRLVERINALLAGAGPGASPRSPAAPTAAPGTPA
jgi:hypothetical protein